MISTGRRKAQRQALSRDQQKIWVLESKIGGRLQKVKLQRQGGLTRACSTWEGHVQDF